MSSPNEIRPFDESLPMALLKAREAAMRLFRPLLAEHDLTEQQWRVLRALGAADQALEVGAIADATFLLGPSLSRILSNLEKRKLIRRQAVSGDLRRSAVSLTTAGTRMVATVAPRSEAIYARIEASYGADRLRNLLAELSALAALETDLDAHASDASDASENPDEMREAS